MSEIVLIVQDDGGTISEVLQTTPVNIQYMDLREIDSDESGWYSRDTLMHAEKWPEEWRKHFAGVIELCIAKVQEAGIELPAWVKTERDAKFTALLSEIENL